jgi:hypothetical protein
MTKTAFDTREAWLISCVDLLRPDFERVGTSVPDKIRASCGWPSKSGLAAKKRRIGEAWSAKCSGDETFEVFISPVLKDAQLVLATLVHEIVHCAVGVEQGHKGAFKRIAIAIGLEGKMTDTTAGPELLKRIEEIVTEVGPYPHAELKSSNAPKKQGTRMLLVKCPACEYQVRTTKKWLEVGVPTCPCGTEMVADDSANDGDED